MQPTMNRPADQAYLLRLWFEGSHEGAAQGTWRFSLEAPRTGARRSFADFEGLVAFLAGQLEARLPASAEQEDGP